MEPRKSIFPKHQLQKLQKPVLWRRYTEEEIRTGLGPALEEFLQAHAAEWVVARKDENNNGLTVLQRVGPHGNA